MKSNVYKWLTVMSVLSENLTFEKFCWTSEVTFWNARKIAPLHCINCGWLEREVLCYPRKSSFTVIRNAETATRSHICADFLNAKIALGSSVWKSHFKKIGPIISTKTPPNVNKGKILAIVYRSRMCFQFHLLHGDYLFVWLFL